MTTIKQLADARHPTTPVCHTACRDLAQFNEKYAALDAVSAADLLEQTVKYVAANPGGSLLGLLVDQAEFILSKLPREGAPQGQLYEILDRRVNLEAQTYQDTRQEDIETLEELLEDERLSGNEFLRSLLTQLEEGRQLTPRQRDAMGAYKTSPSRGFSSSRYEQD
jgi:hypothetical protein